MRIPKMTIHIKSASVKKKILWSNLKSAELEDFVSHFTCCTWFSSREFFPQVFVGPIALWQLLRIQGYRYEQTCTANPAGWKRKWLLWMYLPWGSCKNLQIENRYVTSTVSSLYKSIQNGSGVETFSCLNQCSRTMQLQNTGANTAVGHWPQAEMRKKLKESAKWNLKPQSTLCMCVA